MNISDIYDSNDKIHERTKQIVGNLSDEQKSFLPEDEKWSIATIIEHIAIVQEGMAKISAKLLSEAQRANKKADGAARLSENFKTKAAEAAQLKLEAPERVRPKGVQTIEESLRKMDENQKTLQDLRPLFESVECDDFKFPHPFMGDLTAHEWLALIGGHEARHQAQIKKILEKSVEK